MRYVPLGGICPLYYLEEYLGDTILLVVLILPNRSFICCVLTNYYCVCTMEILRNDISR